MTMRITVAFERPLDSEQRIVFLLNVAQLAKSRRVRWTDGGHGAEIIGTAMGRERVESILREAELPIERVESTLSADENALVEEAPDSEASLQERLRPIGR